MRKSICNSDTVRSRLRLASALALLKLATAGTAYQDQLASNFHLLAWTAQVRYISDFSFLARASSIDGARADEILLQTK